MIVGLVAVKDLSRAVNEANFLAKRAYPSNVDERAPGLKMELHLRSQAIGTGGTPTGSL
jgi:hypothetical protein